MRRRVARQRDTFDAAALPFTPDTELSHRTDPYSPATNRRKTLFVLAWQVALSLLLVLPTKFIALVSLSLPALGAVFLPIIAWQLFDSLVAFLRSQPFKRQLLWMLAIVLAWPLYTLLSQELSTRQSYLVVFGPAVVASAALAHLMAKQFAHWMSVNVRLEKETVGRWQGYWSYIGKPVTPEGCPEVESYRVGFLALVPAYIAGFLALGLLERTTLAPYAGLLAIASFGLSAALLWALWSASGVVPWMSPRKVLFVTWRGLVTWCRYNYHQTIAPGVFQFPTVVFRRVIHRYIASTIPLFLLSFTTAQMEGPPFREFLTEKAHEMRVGRDVLDVVDDRQAMLARLTPTERAWHDRLPEEHRAEYLAEVQDRHLGKKASDDVPGWTVATIGHAALLFAGITAGPLALLFLIAATTTGRLLLAYYEALEAPDATEVKDDAWPWDNRVHRMLTSRNPLERDHVYLGRSVWGDYPVLLHLKLLQQHAHILGDTGSRKTSVGIAPLMTQLIARADSSILVLDLKGDKGLFECARDEAERAGLPFRYFTNVSDRASHVFNPLDQSHSDRLTIHQRTQSILQALSLEYGEGYGEGYFSAVNEIVLKEYLAHYTSVDSIRALYELVRVSQAYKAIGGVHDDWKNARHLAILLDKLSSVYPMNVTKATLRDRPRAWEERIDMPSLLSSKQVVYFYLSSAIEPTTVSPVARLAMFNLLTAAAQLEGRGNRVYVFVDEFQRIVTENLRLFLEQARSMRLHFILANQTMGQLRGKGLDLVDTVESCTAYKQMFKATDLDTLERLEKSSGEALYHENSWQVLAEEGFNGYTDRYYGDDEPGVFQAKETVGPRLERNTLIELSAASWLSLVRFTEGSGYTQYSGYLTPMVHEFHIPESEFVERTNRQWPAVDERTVLEPMAEDKGPKPDASPPGDRVRSVIDRLDGAPAPQAETSTPERVTHE